jgi:tetratricopeptide (TPR) repeat protein
MIRLLLTFAFIAWFVCSDVFAQRGAQQAQQQPAPAPAATIEEEEAAVEDFFVRLPVQNDEAGRMATWALERVQTILRSLPPLQEDEHGVSFLPPMTKEDREIIWQRAFNAIGALSEFVNPPNPEEFSGNQPDFVLNVYANAHFLLGSAMIYIDMTRYGFFDDSTNKALAQNAAEKLEAFAENGIGTATGYPLLVQIYTEILENPSRALVFANRLVAAEPNCSGSHFIRATALRALGRSGEACAALKRAYQLDDNKAVYETIMQNFGC